ncbi:MULTISPECIES: Ger(x)C family spore germination protein [Paenibacillus]|uniref:Ger(x)C family spore germination protein n=1 Tax=Paenibacillus TaxID=44249 RepID=UPI0022B8CC1F|nr:Ger(x)C family spore germination protein [Paenibacillus caseinilyticus]MCZ8521023.1 Ger(x)C family spore germination protein [Paenibacillus caseinilyticus]
MKKVTLLLLPMLLLTGCWDRLELEEQAFVVVLGLDKGKNNMVAVTFQIANPQVGSSDKGAAPNEPPSDIVTFTAPDILSAKELANSVITRKISFAHLRTTVVSQDLARTELYHHVIGSSIRDPEMRREIHLIVSKERASDFIKNNKPRLETRPHKYYAFMQQRWKDTGFVPYSTLNRYLQRLGGDSLFLSIYATTEPGRPKYSKGEDNYLAGQIPQKGGDPVQIMGSAVFSDGKMIGTLTGEETRLALFLRRKSLTHSFISTYTDPANGNYQVTVRYIKDGNTKIKVNTGVEPAQVSVTLPLRVQVLSIPSLANYATDADKQKLLKESLERQMTEKIQHCVAKAQKEFKGEPFLWHLHARKTFWTMPEYIQYDWSKHFAKAQVEVKVELKIENFGKQIETPKTSEKAGGSEE